MTVAPSPRVQRALASTVVLVTLSAIGANSFNYVSALRPGPDAGVYAFVGLQLLDGRALYKDTVDAKPPVIYTLNATALALGGRSFHSIRLLERVWAVGCVILAYLVVLEAFKRRTLAFVIAIAFSFLAYSDWLFEEGNVTEEYALLFVLGGIYCALRGSQTPVRPPASYTALSGAAFGLATLTKEPFVLSSLPWFLLLVIRPSANWTASPWTAYLQRALLFVSGALVPVALFLGYLIVTSSFSPWLETVVGSAAYIRSLQPARPAALALREGVQAFTSNLLEPTLSCTLAFGIGILATVLSPSFRARTRYVPVVVLIALLTDLTGATLSPALYGHYFLQVLPAFLLCAAGGVALILDIAQQATRHYRWVGGLLLLLTPAALDSSVALTYAQRLHEPFARAPLGPVSTVIRDNSAPTDQLWVSALGNARFYVETGLTPPTVYGAYFNAWFTDTWSSTRANKIARLKTELTSKPPAWIITSADESELASIQLLDWVCDSYTLLPVADKGFSRSVHLYRRNDHTQPDSVTPGADGTCASLYIDKSLSLYARGEWHAALAAATRASVLDPLSITAHNNMCVGYIQLHNYDAAIEQCQRGLTLEPRNGLLRSNLAWAEAERSRQR